MGHINVEIKARCRDTENIRRILTEHKAEFKGLDHQVDTYYQVRKGRLKLREGNIENNLIYYERADTADAKQSDVILHPVENQSELKDILGNSLDTLVVVDKKREIWFIDNVKFHIDSVKELGSFIEIEAIDTSEGLGYDTLLEQCNYYKNLFRVADEDLVEVSYSDLLIRISSETNQS